MSSTKYLRDSITLNPVVFSLLLKNTRNSPKQNSTKPWAISPNITPNRKGKVIAVKIPGLT